MQRYTMKFLHTAYDYKIIYHKLYLNSDELNTGNLSIFFTSILGFWPNLTILTFNIEQPYFLFISDIENFYGSWFLLSKLVFNNHSSYIGFICFQLCII